MTAATALLTRVARSHNLTEANYQHIVRVLGRQPTVTEVGIFGVMYSEHCSYASSKVYLKTFPTKGKRILVPAGKENAGVVDIGDGWAVAFKVESHNHPSAVEPHAGAATGVGGILRDIFTMGARPIALFDSLRFGPLTPPPAAGLPKAGRAVTARQPRAGATGGGVNGHARTRFVFDGVVRGIADYGNCVGVPTVGGEIAFDETYRENPLVNVMCLGLVPRYRVARAVARGVGNPVLYVGSSTGRDGLGGASFASREITDGSEADRPAVQIGDPFAEKCLIEATLEALATGDVVGIQDMGAAGLTCSSCEMPAKGGSGIEIDVAKVPRREPGMTPYEVMLSESQERMLLVVRRGRERHLQQLFAKWGLKAVVIGRVTADGRMRVKDGRTVVAEIPVSALTDDAPVYHRPVRRPRYLARAQRLSLARVPQPADAGETLLRLLGSPTIASKAPVYEQYDHMVQTNTVVLPGRADAAVLRLPAPPARRSRESPAPALAPGGPGGRAAIARVGPGKRTDRWLAATTDGNGRFCYLDPYEGGQLAVAEAARNLLCVGAKPLAITNCLNFGSPEDPEIMWQFTECVRGIAQAARALGTPVTGGNVSFYNEGPRARPGSRNRRARGAVDPTPVIGMIGLIECGVKPVTANFKDEGDAIILLGETREELGGSEYLAVLHGRKAGRPPKADLPHERALQRVMLDLTGRRLVKSAHDCSDGGLAVCLAECCMMDEEHSIGAVVNPARITYHLSLRPDSFLFGETAGRIIMTCERHHVEQVEHVARRCRVPASVVGRVGGRRLAIGAWIDLPIETLNRAWRSGLKTALG